MLSRMRANARASSDLGRATANPAAMPLLVAQSVEKAYRRRGWVARHRVPVLRGADLALLRGGVVGRVGENGSGKTRLMRILVR